MSKRIWNQNYLTIKSNLLKGRKLSYKEKLWLGNQRKRFYNPSSFSAPLSRKQLISLNELNNYLDTPWELPRIIEKKSNRPAWEDIKLNFEKKGVLKDEHIGWLEKQNSRYRRDPSKIDDRIKEELDKLSEITGIDWKTIHLKGRVVEFERIFNLIRQRKKLGKPLSQFQSIYIRDLKEKFIYQRPSRFLETRSPNFLSFLGLLDSNWYEEREAHKRNLKSKESTNSKKVGIWLKQHQNLLNFQQIEKHLGITKGMIQKFVKYDKKLNVENTEKLFEFIKELSKGI